VVYVGIVIGIDKQGKTTLINEMKKVLPEVRVRKVVEHPRQFHTDDILRIAAQHVLSWKADEGAPIIYDRFPIPDEFIYGEATGADALASWEEAMTSVAKVSYIYVYPSVLTRYMERAHGLHDDAVDIKDPETVKRLLRKYHEFTLQTNTPLLRLSSSDFFTDSDATDCLRFILQGSLTWQSGGTEQGRIPRHTKVYVTSGLEPVTRREDDLARFAARMEQVEDQGGQDLDSSVRSDSTVEDPAAP
jgi:hypothetical protein